MDAAVKTGDPLGPQAYIDLADSMYRSINKGVSDRGLVPLPLAGDDDSEARRAMLVVSECKQNMALSYAEAVAFAYIAMRKALGLPVEMPNETFAKPSA
jgi:hypothetical protein